MKNKIKSILKRGKAFIAAAAIAVTSAMTAVVACAEEGASGTSGSEMSTVLANAGEQISNQFSDLVNTILPVILGILCSGLVIFGIMALVKLAKKVFNKVAG